MLFVNVLAWIVVTVYGADITGCVGFFLSVYGRVMVLRLHSLMKCHIFKMKIVI